MKNMKNLKHPKNPAHRIGWGFLMFFMFFMGSSCLRLQVLVYKEIFILLSLMEKRVFLKKPGVDQPHV